MRHVFTLVHGTFARGASWTNRDSEFCRRLARVIGESSVEFVRFEWSGRNSPFARRKAADKLAEQLRATILSHPTARHYVIGHSHGGNVITMALDERFLRERIAGVACLSTPFLAARKRPLVSPFRELAIGGLSLALVFGNAPWRLLAAAYLMVFVYAWLKGLPQRLLDVMREPDLTGLNLLILRTPADETSAVFAVSHILGWISARLYACVPAYVRRALVTPSKGSAAIVISMALIYLAFVLSMTFVGVVFIEVIEYVFAKYLTPEPGIQWWVVLGSFLLALLAPIGFLASISAANAVVLSLCSVGFGIATACCAIVVEVSAEAAPRGRGRFHQVGFSEAKKESSFDLQHSGSYSDPRAIEAVVDWVLEFDSPANPPTRKPTEIGAD